MVVRKYPTIKCGGCNRDFSLIKQSHIDECKELRALNILSTKDYKKKFGNLMSEERLQVSIEKIKAFNNSMTAEQRKVHAKTGYDATIKKHENFASSGGIKGAEALWSKPEQKKRHNARYRELLYKALHRLPNKTEEKFLDIFSNQVEFVSYEVWQRISGEKPHCHNRMPDFVIIGQEKKIIDIFGERAHKKDSPGDRIEYWKSREFDSIVIWESEVHRKYLRQKTIEKVQEFISRNSHERETSDGNDSEDDMI
jgi:hypothetical protein